MVCLLFHPQTITRTSANLLSTRYLETNNDIWVTIVVSTFAKLPLKMSSAKRWPICFGFDGPNPTETEIFRQKQPNTIAIDNVAPCVAMASAASVLPLQDEVVLVLIEEGFRLPTFSKRWDMMWEMYQHYYALEIIAVPRVSLASSEHLVWATSALLPPLYCRAQPRVRNPWQEWD